MVSKKSRSEVRVNKHRKLRNRLAGTTECPRLAVFRSCLLYTSDVYKRQVFRLYWKKYKKIKKRLALLPWIRYTKRAVT